MEIQSNEQALMRRKRRIRLYFGLFIALLIGCTLFSNTMISLTLPKVVLITTGRGELNHTYSGSGIVKWRSEVPLTNPSGAKVEKINVEKGQLVKKGQTLILYDQEDVGQQLLDEKGNLAKLKLSIEKLQKDFIIASQSNDPQLIESAKHALRVSEIDLDAQERRIQKLEKSIADNRTLTAPFDGLITTLNAMEGQLPAGGADLILANTSQGFEFSLTLAEEAVEAIAIGGKLDVQINGPKGPQMEGVVEAIEDAASDEQIVTGEEGANSGSVVMKKLRVALPGQSLKGGERAQVELSQTTEDVVLVPNKAIHEEGDSSYVLGLEVKDGPLGNSFFVRKIKVTLASRTDTQSVITEGLFEQQQIILESSEPLQEGDQVRLH